jgi:hypothetical protein
MEKTIQLKNTNEEESFVSCNNFRAKNIVELREAIAFMTDAEFEHHCNKDKNDFANWIEHCLDDTSLAGNLKKAATKDATLKVIDAHLSLITREIGKNHVVNDFTLIKDFLIGLIIGLIAGGIIGKLLL